MLLLSTRKILRGHEPSLRNWVIINVSIMYLRKYLLSCIYEDWELSIHVMRRYALWPLNKTISYAACKHMVNDFFEQEL
jgi:hypothetical protein